MTPTHYTRIVIGALLVVASVVCTTGCSTTDPANTTLRTRKNVLSLTAQERTDFVSALKQLKTVKSPYDTSLNYYDQFVYWHLKAFYCMGGGMNGMYPAHQNPAFLPWHRVYVDLFERALRTVSGKDITIPYWDWTNAASVSTVFANDFMGGDGDPAQGYAVTSGPFQKDSFQIRIFDTDDIDSIFDDVDTDPNPVPYLVRAFTKFKDSSVVLPNAAEMEQTLNIATYDSAPWNSSVDSALSFRNALEGWRGTRGDTCEDGIMDVIPTPARRSQQHNVVHIWVGGVVPSGGKVIAGNMTQASSPNDPVFWIHHANIDRLWSAWMKRHGRTYVPVSGGPMGANINDVMAPFSFKTDGKNTPGSVTDESVLGYQYEAIP